MSQAFALYRCAGGKRKVARKLVKRILKECGNHGPVAYCEPFCASGAVCLALLEKSGTVERVWVNDLDRGSYALWWSMINQPDELLRLVHGFEPSREAFFQFQRDFLENREFSLLELALRKLAVHQMSFSGMGVMAGGPLREIASRWSPRCIERNLRKAHRLLNGKQVIVTNLDFRAVLAQVDEETFVFADPPYMMPGKSLYQFAFSQRDHEELRDMLARAQFRWLLTYDNCAEVRRMYSNELIRRHYMTSTVCGVSRKSELLITPRPRDVQCHLAQLVEPSQPIERPDMFMGPGELLNWPRNI